MVKASAVASKPVMSTADTTPGVAWNLHWPGEKNRTHSQNGGRDNLQNGYRLKSHHRRVMTDDHDMQSENNRA